MRTTAQRKSVKHIHISALSVPHYPVGTKKTRTDISVDKPGSEDFKSLTNSFDLRKKKKKKRKKKKKKKKHACSVAVMCGQTS
ncbi:hypothetical protein JOB18_031138 [Solea senegalensis]|uniref:Uncharacterized protein n=1 Tax=Solea senegalensis TaxID=28829 RepID=A0AAV6T881_SOLSE|nr:hypothetical protein JOB18_031138 [Solea senegalensis]